MPCLPFAVRLPCALARAVLAAAPCSLVCVLRVVCLCVVYHVCVCFFFVDHMVEGVQVNLVHLQIYRVFFS